MGIALAEYDPSWPARFADEAARVAAALGRSCAGVEHIGSTANVNSMLSGDAPETRVEASTPVECRARLAARENRELLTQFVRDLNAATAKRHAGGRHGVAHTGLRVAKDCSTVTATLEAGTL